MRIGKYLIFSSAGKVWITIADDGEGGEFNEAELEKVIDEFYREKF